MASKTKKDRQRNSMEWIKWQWEYARRNPEVKKAYQQALELRKRVKHSLVEVPLKNGKKIIIYSYLETPEGQEEKRLCEALGLHFDCMIDPDKSYDDLMRGPDSMEKACFLPFPFWETFLTKGPRWEGSCLKDIEIDFAKVNSIEALKDEVGRLLDIYYDVYKTARKKHYEQKTVKRRNLPKPEELERSLDVGRMKEDGLTYNQIAKKIFQNDVDPDSVKSKLSKDYKRFKYYVYQGGYRELTYP